MLDIENMALIDPAELTIAEPFNSLFSRPQSRIDEYAANMRERGFDEARPIVVWRQRNVVIDGHTRRDAAIQAGVGQVPVVFRDFENEDAAFDYAVREQRDRRNLSDADLAELIQKVDRRKVRGGDRKSKEFRPEDRPQSKASSEAIGKSAEKTAELVGTSRAKVEKVRRIVADAEQTGDTSQLDAVKAGAVSINQAAQNVAAKKALVWTGAVPPESRASARRMQTIRDKAKAEAEKRSRETYSVESDLEYLSSFPKVGQWAMTLDELVAEIVGKFGTPDDDPELDSWMGRDLAIWRSGRLRAIVRRGPDGAPIANTFDDSDEPEQGQANEAPEPAAQPAKPKAPRKPRVKPKPIAADPEPSEPEGVTVLGPGDSWVEAKVGMRVVPHGGMFTDCDYKTGEWRTIVPKGTVGTVERITPDAEWPVAILWDNGLRMDQCGSNLRLAGSEARTSA